MEEEVYLDDVSIRVTGWEAAYDPDSDSYAFVITFDFANYGSEVLSAYWALDMYAYQGDTPLYMLELPADSNIYVDLEPGEYISDCVIRFQVDDDSPVTFQFVRYMSDPEIAKYITLSQDGN